SIPSVGTDQAALGPYRANASEVTLLGVGSKLNWAADGSLVGDLPSGLVPVYTLKAQFRRSPAPTLAPTPKPAGRPPAPLWKRNVGGPVFGDIGQDPQTGRILVATTTGKVVALRANGTLAWSTDVGSPLRAGPVPASGAIFAATDDTLVKL